MKTILIACIAFLFLACSKDATKDTKIVQTKPLCQLTGISLFDNPTPENIFKITTSGDKITEVKSSGKEFVFAYTIANGYFNNRYFKDLTTGYTSEIQYAHFADGSTSNVFLFAGGACIGETDYVYSNGNISVIKRYPNALTLPDKFSSKEELIWEDGNITSIKYTKGQDVCTHYFTYNTDKSNPLSTNFKNLLWCDPSTEFGDFNKAVFLSKNLPAQLTASCSGVPVKNFTYTYNASGQIRDIKIDGKNTWSFQYSCD